MKSTSISDRIWLLVAGVLLLLTVVCVVQAVAQGPQREFYEQAREALNESEYRRAADFYAQAYDSDTQGDLAGECLYWQAFSLYRIGEMKDLRKAVDLLELHQKKHREASTFADAEALKSRIYGEMARRGDAGAAREIHEAVAMIEMEHAELEHDAERMSHEKRRRAHEIRQISRQARELGRIPVPRGHRGRGVIIRSRGEDSAKMAALNALMMMDEEKALPIVKKIIADGDPENAEMRRNVIYLLGQMDGRNSRAIMLDLAAKETDPEIQSELVMWLGFGQDEECLDAIMDIYERADDIEVKEATLYALGQHGGPRAIEKLKTIAIDEQADPDLRIDAVFSLSQSQADGIGSFLMETYRSGGDTDVLESVIYALTVIDADVPAAWFEEIIADKNLDSDLRGQTLFGASRKGAFTADFLRKAYQSSDERDFKSHVCYALAEMGDEDGLEALIRIADQETDPDLREELIFWIGQQDDDRAAEFLMKIINED